MTTLLTSALMFASVALGARYGYELAGGWFNRRVARDAEKIRGWSDELFLGWSAEKIRRAALWSSLSVVVAGALAWLLTGSPVFTVAFAFAVYWVPPVMYRVAKARRWRTFDEQLPDAINIMVSSVRAGRSLPQAIEDVSKKMSGPAGQEFGVMAKEYAYGGMNVEGVLERARARLNVESFTMISSALIINSVHGGEVLHMLERMSSAIRELHRLKKKIYTETAEVRAQEKIIMLITPVFGVMVCLFDPEIPGILFSSIIGNIILVFVVGCQIISVWWIHRIISSTI